MAKIPLQKKAILEAMKVAETTPQAAVYLLDQYNRKVKETKLPGTYSDMIAEFVTLIKHKLRSRSQPWNGKAVDFTDFQNMQANIADDASKRLEHISKNTNAELVLDFAVNDKAQFLRGYSSEGNALDSDTVVSLDELFNAWLVEKNLVSKEGMLFESDDNGQIRIVGGQQVKANPDKIRQLISDPKQGFEHYMDTKGINLTSQQHEYPSEHVEAERVVEEIIEAPVAEVMANEEGQPKVAPKTR
jgi:hypothetical protein